MLIVNFGPARVAVGHRRGRPLKPDRLWQLPSKPVPAPYPGPGFYVIRRDTTGNAAKTVMPWDRRIDAEVTWRFFLD